jgi:hypothetical protein
MSRMMTKVMNASSILNAPSPDDLKRTFEVATAQVHQPLNPFKLPIGFRKRTTALPTAHTSEDRALADAARALARLWNIAQTAVR